MLGIPQYLWRLLPGNPILLRVLAVHSKRTRDLLIRSIYLGVLVFFVVMRLVGGGGSISGASLDVISQNSAIIFKDMSLLQLALVTLLAPIFTAAAITQEKDSQTYDILLATPLTNGQIVLGTLFSRLFFIVALLISGIPIFAITQIFGGVAISSIVVSFLIAAVTALACGALAVAIATFKVGTRRTIFSFYMVVVIYVVGGLLADQLTQTKIALADPVTGQPSGELSTTSWLTPLNPFLALLTIFRQPTYTPPTIEMLPAHLQGRPIAWAITSPASFYVSMMLAFSAITILPSIVVLRRIAQSSFTLRSWVLQKLRLGRGTRTRKPRSVWSNPIAWREARTKASAARASLLRYGFVLVGIGAVVWLLVLHGMITGAPTKRVAPGSLSADGQTLTVIGGDTFAITDATQVLLNDRPIDRPALNGRFEVVGELAVMRGRIRELTQIKLKPLDRRMSHDDLRQFLLGLVVLELAVILLIVTNAAASTVTREKEDGTLDLLLTAPITSRYYIWGKLRGLVSFALPLLAVPMLSLGLVIAYDAIRYLAGNGMGMEWIVLPEALLVLPPLLVIVTAFAAIVGMQMSLRCRTTVRAVMASIGIVLGAFALLAGCGNMFVGGNATTSEVSLAFGSLSPFTVISVLLWPQQFAAEVFSGDSRTTARLVVTIFTLLAGAAYAATVYGMYRSMVTNFDMTIRKQSQ